MKILLTGGSGRLGTELRKLRAFEYAPTHTEMDIADFLSVVRYLKGKEVDLIVNAAAYTNTAKADIDREACWRTNVDGPKNLALQRLPVLHISTEYVFDGQQGMYTEKDFPNPINYYAMTKLIGEQQARAWAKIVRLIFKPRPWPFSVAYDDQWTSGDYVDVMAKEVDKAITLFDKLPWIVHLGTGRKTMYDLAKVTRQDVTPNSILAAAIPLPRDCSLDISLWTQLKKENGIP